MVEAEHLCMSMRGREEARDPHRHLVGAGPVPLRRRHPGRGDAVRPRPLIGPAGTPTGRAVRVRWPPCRAYRRGRPLVMGVLNVTPDSFSDGGRYLRRRRRRGPRPGAWSPRAPTWSTWAASRAGRAPSPVAEAEELRRVVPVIEALAPRRPGVGRHREAGGRRGGRGRRGHPRQRHLGRAVAGGRRARGGLGGHAHAGHAPPTCSGDPRYDDVVAEVHGFVLDRAAGPPPRGGGRGLGRPGDRLRQDGRRTTWPCWPTWASWPRRPGPRGSACWSGTSRKSFLGAVRGRRTAEPAAAGDRLEASLATGHLGHGPGRDHGAGRTTWRRPCEAARLVGRRAVGGGGVKGKWAAGIPPRNFTWIIRDRLAVSERPGGFAPNHRRVRRQEEIIWLRVQGFTRVVSLLPSPHNLARLRGGGARLRPLPPGPRADPRGRPGRLLRRPRPLPGRGAAHPRPPGRAGRPGHGRGGRLPRVVGPHARAGPRPWPWSSTWSGTRWARPGASWWWPSSGMPPRQAV